MWTLFHLKFKRHFRAEGGGAGSKSRSSGADGEDIYIDVPLGTIIRDADTDEIIVEITEDKKEVIDISEDQVTNFAGNMLQVQGNNNERFLIMSQAAYDSLTKDQINRIEKHCKIISSSLSTIETCGGGSARCMMAEVFLPKQ